MVCYYTYHNVSVYAKLQEIYKKYGYVFDTNVSTQYQGINAMKDMNAVVDKMKTVKIESIAGVKVNAVRDYSSATRTLADGTQEQMQTEKVNAVYYELENGGFICIRPSGTEPKLKVYYSIPAGDKEQANILFQSIKGEFEEYIK